MLKADVHRGPPGGKPGLLDGLKVLEATRGMAGAVAGMLLADNGADVLKMEPASGDPLRELPASRVWNRGKRSAVVDLSGRTGEADFMRLCSTADLLIENFDSATASRLRLDERLRERFPRLVRVSITGYGENDPRRDFPCYEHLVDAWLGVMDVQLGRRDGPKFNAYPLASYGAAFLAVTGGLAAIQARATTGRGQSVATSLVDGAFFLSTMQWHSHEKGRKILPPGMDPSLQRRHLLDMGVLECSDSRLLIIHTGVAGRFAAALEVMGIHDKVTPAPPELEKNAPLTPQERAFLIDRVPKIIRTRPRSEWLRAFEAADVCCMPVDPPGAVFDDPQAVFDGVVASVDDPVLGRIRMLGPVLKCEEAPPRISRPAPILGEHTTEAMTAAAAANRRPSPSRSDGGNQKHALAGIRIVDFGNFYAGPGASRILGDLGAEVIKVEPLKGDLFRATASAFPAANRGKRSIALDLKTAEGRSIAHELVARADIVTHNMRPNATRRLGLDFETLKRVQPRLIYLYSPGFGGAGPRSHLTAFAPLLSGMAGVSEQSAGRGNRPIATWISNEDQVGACLGAVWLTMALHYRERTGRAVRLESSLFSAALFCASEVLMDHDGRTLFRFEVDGEQLGYGPLCRIYRTRDGWIVLVAPRQEHFIALSRLPGLERLLEEDLSTPGQRAGNGQALASILEPWFRARTSREVQGMLNACGVPNEIPARSRIESWLLDEENRRAGRVHECVDAIYGRMRTQGHAVRFSDTPGLIRGGPPLVGEHSREILRELGYSDSRIDELARIDVVSCGRSEAAPAG